MTLKKWLKKSLKGGIARFLPVAILASAADAGVLCGVRSFIEIIGGKTDIPLLAWLAGMVALALLRLFFLLGKSRISENWLYGVSSRVQAFFLHRLRSLPPRVFHTPKGEREVESAYEATVVLQNNGGVFFQAVQAVLQLMVFLPVLFYISWPLTLFLFVVIVPFVALLQRRLHRLGPAEESLMRLRSDFRGDLTLARRLFRQWSSRDERSGISDGLLKCVRRMRDEGASAAIKKSQLSLWAETVSVTAMVFVLAFCALLMGRGYMDASGLVLFASAVLLCYKPVKECARVMPQFRAAMSALDILEKFESLGVEGSVPARGFVSVMPAGDEVMVRDGRFRYEGADQDVFSDLEVRWSREKPVLVRGRNGVGKSTFLRLLAGLERWNSAKVSAPRDVFFVAQDLELPPRWMLLRLMNRLKADEKDKLIVLEKFMTAAGTAPLLEKPGLSGGERARVALLWALASAASTVLLDEPFASVSLDDREPLLVAYLDAAKKLGKWTIIVSHDVLSAEVECIFKTECF
ncbi:ABC transporter ATP-binding protein [Fibrobacter sp. UWH4]|uniref:ABC transporter ATP-binding protein n=1 Tax=Fibrobacter sp. UWH4 TaxID=1896210 RepID=UPI000916F060|nr:ABC transporter ATP-binding protein [Fibrobacter sp. UWH4]SHK58252.1 ABC-type multidrug transport system, ATPase and permease component [Fibrobacter sp. UWH4]